MFEPGPPASSPEALLGQQVELIEIELRRIDARIRSIGWGAPSPRRLSVSDEWALTAGTIELPDYGDGDAVARACLANKRDHLLEELRRLRARLTGQSGGNRRAAGDEARIRLCPAGVPERPWRR